MKKTVLLISLLALMLSLVSCDVAQNSESEASSSLSEASAQSSEEKNENESIDSSVAEESDSSEAQTETSEQVSENVSADSSTEEESTSSNASPEALKEIESIKDNSKDLEISPSEEIFFEDGTNVYYFNNLISQHIIVSYKDGTTENVKDALANGHIRITDLDTYNIGYSVKAKNAE